MTQKEKKQFVYECVDEVLKDETCDLTTVLKILANRWKTTVSILKQYLEKTKYGGESPIECYINGKGLNRFDFTNMAGYHFTKIVKSVIAKNKISIYDATCIVFKCLKIPITPDNMEKAGEMIRIYSAWVFNVKSKKNIELLNIAYSKHSPAIKAFKRIIENSGNEYFPFRVGKKDQNVVNFLNLK